MPSSPFTKLLKMQLVAADIDGKVAAQRAGIARSRFYEISCGRARPTSSEMQALLHVALIAPLRKDRLLRAVRTDPTGLAWTLWRAIQVATVAPSSVDARLSIDRLSFTANARSVRVLRAIAARLGERRFGDAQYRERHALPGLTLELEPNAEGGRFARVELYSNELAKPSASLEVFDALDLTSAVLTRVDVAVDLDVSPRRVHVIPSNKRKVRALWYWGSVGRETLYLFAAPHMVRIYDKGLLLTPQVSVSTVVEGVVGGVIDGFPSFPSYTL